jgi:GxxExxY protein
MSEIQKDVLTEKIIGCCFKVHTALGPGFKELNYHNALIIELEKNGFSFVSEKVFELYYSGKRVGIFKCDLFIEEKIIVEIKAVTGIMPVLFRNQVIAYLKASKVKTGLLVNFGNKSCEIKRVAV